ncbi:MAG: hypothetical protein AB7O52_19915 [Planctomycetota bacterium]
MKVRCRFASVCEVGDETTTARLLRFVRIPGGHLNVTVGAEYVVYGILFRDNAPWYYLCLADDDESPTPFPAEIFDVVDHRLSRHWQLASIARDDGSVSSCLVVPEWAEDPIFLERLAEGDPKATETFAAYRIKMDEE